MTRTIESSTCRTIGRSWTRNRSASSVQTLQRFVFIDADRLVAQVSACGHDRKIELAHEQMVQRRIREHDAKIRISRSDRLRQLVETAAEPSCGSPVVRPTKTIGDSGESEQPFLEPQRFAIALAPRRAKDTSARTVSLRDVSVHADERPLLGCARRRSAGNHRCLLGLRFCRRESHPPHSQTCIFSARTFAAVFVPQLQLRSALWDTHLVARGNGGPRDCDIRDRNRDAHPELFH